MASTGKKGKKSKEKKLSLQDFLATSTPAAGGTTQVAIQKVSSWAEECEDDEDHKKIEFIQLPTAPRAARILEDSSIPQDPPFYARVANLPFDTNEGELDELFSEANIRVREMKLARDDQNDRLRGFGILEFETREDLIDTMMLNDPTIRGRRIRLEVTTDPDSFSGRTVRKRYDNYGSRDGGGETNTNWRERKESNFETVDGYERRDRGERRNYQQRSTFQNRHDNNGSNDGGDDTNWRMGERPVNDSPPPERRRFNDRRGGDRDDRRGGDRDDRRGGDRGDRGENRRYDRREPRESTQEERPRLNIAPRTLPLPELNFPKEEELERGTRKISLNGDKNHHDDSGLPDDTADEKSEAPKAKPVPKEDIFGQAKPVDTAAREKEIEDKMEREREEKIRVERDKRESDREDAPDTEKKDVIMIQTESSRRRGADEINWRTRDDNPSSNGERIIDNKSRHMGGSGGGRQIGRNDPRPFKDNRDNRNYNNNNRGMNRDRDRRSFGRDGPPRRDQQNSGNDMRDRDTRDSRDSREPRDPIRRDLPKYSEDTGPNLHVSNAFAGLDDEVDAD